MAASIYADLEFPAPTPGRPYVFINMVSTIDGKITTGGRGEPVQDLGSAVDHATMHSLEAMADGMMIGAGTLRATPRINVDRSVARFCVSGSGQVDFSHNFFADNPRRAWIVTTEEGTTDAPAIRAGRGQVEMKEVLRQIRALGISLLLCEGGSELNASLFREDLVDEVFLTIAPKIRLGRDVPTLADGEALNREEMRRFALVSVLPVEDEVFLRYRRHR